MLRERGHTQGFTLQPKFTYWESLTPEPLLTLLLSGSRTVIPQRFEQGLIHDTLVRYIALLGGSHHPWVLHSLTSFLLGLSPNPMDALGTLLKHFKRPPPK